jgi:predicted nuclease with TOPRIM domain
MATNKNTIAKDGNQLSDQNLSDLISRIDERVKILIESQKDFDEQLKEVLDTQQNLNNRLCSLELKDVAKFQDDLYSLSERIAILSNEESRKDFSDLRNKAHALEIRFENIQTKLNNHDNRWNSIFDAIWKFALMIITGFILYKLGIQAPPS